MTKWLPALGSRGDEPLYRALAQAIVQDCLRGRLKPGDRLPTHRDLADRLGVTVGTVSRGYAEAARRGVLTGEVGRGTFVRGSASPPEEAAEADGFVDLGINHPATTASEPHARALSQTLAALSERTDLARLLDYPLEGGLPAHREAAAAWIRRGGLDVKAERVLVCSGSQHGLLVTLATLLEPGDLLLAEEMTYPGLKTVADVLRLRLRPVALDAQGLRPDALEEACRRGGAKAVYCVPTIQNPTAGVMPLSRRRALLEVAARHGLAVIEDDIHARLAEGAPPPLASLAPDQVVYLTSVSKTLAPGLRIGFVAAPPPMVGRLAAAIRATAWAAAPLMAEVVATWIRDGTAEAILAERRREAEWRQERARALLDGSRYQAHPFGYHLWLELPEGWRSEEFAAAAHRRGVGLTPAEAFAVGPSAPAAVRIGIGGPTSRRSLERGLQRVLETLASSSSERLAIV